MTEDPMAIGDDKLSSGGTGQFPGAVDFFHSVMFDNGMDTVNWVDESFGRGCPPMTEWRARPWHAASREQDRKHVLLGHGGQLPERVPASATCGPILVPASTARRTWG